ncbi:hypothetical protein [Sorangium sp. So ce1335]|uniref:hypothetical protein n=1 Tax=Sorangium sp. So ce1335 TaxID=3133335 RepID=UPI003F608141
MEEANPSRTPAAQDFIQAKLINVCEWVETEKTGIVSCSSWDEVMRVLQGGIYLDNNSSKDQEVSIEIFRCSA